MTTPEIAITSDRRFVAEWTTHLLESVSGRIMETGMNYSQRPSLTQRQALKLAALLKGRRSARGLSMAQLSAASGVNDATIVRLERGVIRAPQPETLRALGRALGLSSYDLFSTCEWIQPAELPSFGVYLRAKYGQLTAAEIGELEDELHRITDGRTGGPSDKEDE